MSLARFIPNPLAAMASMAGPDTGTAQFGYQRASEGPLCRMLRGEPAPPASQHYNAPAPGIAGLLGEVDQRLIDNAMAERASGQHTLH
ncbi:hypothetical protein HWD96_07865 [Pseudomonas putida]|uniref:hypothetical protein n=1 Tax=Pseudomonas putida TaxID=303 RepID=UPI001F527D02|nr:hypothetical protein [Pseudomonas putida]MCI1022145.1 hypothetical protein [Pseudomonas putida]